MLNIYDERKKENLLFILDSEEEYKEKINDLDDTAIIVNLYYQDTVDRYIGFLKHIPESIHVYVYSSNEAVLETVKKNVKKKNLHCVIKENRGRDISTLLVAAKEIIPQYKLVCFIHDKGANAEYLAEDVNYWIGGLWENTLGSESYIWNILKTFERHPDIGLLVPPEPYGDFNSHWYGNTWRKNFEQTKQMADLIGLNTDISEDKEVFTLGTVFWARTEALKKLFDQNWNYEDFQEEPLPIDGTINHAIERIIGYVAQDAGYKTGTVMTEKHASTLILKVQDDMRMMFYQLQKREHIHNIYQIRNLDLWEQQLKLFYNTYDRIYIYGAGVYGKSIRCFMEDRNWKIDGFVVSPGNKDVSEIENVPVYEINELESSVRVGIIIGVSYEFRDEIETMLKKYGFKNYMNGF